MYPWVGAPITIIAEIIAELIHIGPQNLYL